MIALDLQHEGARRLRHILVAEQSDFAEPSFVSDITVRENVHLGDAFTITLNGYNYEVTVKFEDPR